MLNAVFDDKNKKIKKAELIFFSLSSLIAPIPTLHAFLHF